MIRSGRYNSQSEVGRAALRRMEEEESDYLTPPALTPAPIERIFGPGRGDVRDRKFGKSAFDAVRRAARRGTRP
jgi:Arc/MetJ-type ribon-helix-helix transcriptional regulator